MIDWQAFHFIRPSWFYAIIPAVVLWWLLRVIAKYQSGWHGVISQHLYQRMLGQEAATVRHTSLNALLIAWLFVTFALAGPTWERLPQPVYQLQTGHVVVVDMSMSMRATDVKPDRLTRAKYKVIDLVKQINEGEIGLVAYAGDAFVISPLTRDANNIAALVPSLSPEIMPVPGSTPITGIETASDLLQNAGYKDGFIYWVTDGVELPDVAEIREYMSASPYTLNVLAVGSEQGAPIKQLNGELLKSRTGSIVIPKVDIGSLQTLAKAGRGRFTPMTADEADIVYLSTVSQLEQQNKTDTTETDNAGDQWQEQGPWLVLLILPFALLAFRRGVLVLVCVIGLSGLSVDPVMAQDKEASSATHTTSPWWKRPFQNADQRGLEQYQNAKYEDAAAEFEDANWKGAALYKAGDYEGALAQFNKHQGIDGLFNQANALAQLGQLEEAINRLDNLLALDPDHQDAIFNKSLLESLLEQQQQEQSQQDQENGQNDEQNSQQQQDGNDSQQNQDEQNAEQSNEQPNQGEQDQQSESSSDSNNEQNQQGQDSEATEQNNEPSQAERQDGEEKDGNPQEQQQPIAEGDQQELTDEQKEQQQRLENLMRRIPDDPAFLLKRKMQLEAQKRRREQLPASRRSEW